MRMSVKVCLVVLLQGSAVFQASAGTTIDFEIGQTTNSGHISGDFKSLGVVFTRASAFDIAPPPPGTGTATTDNLTFYRDNTQGSANQSPEYAVFVGGGRDGSARYGTIRADFFDPDTLEPGLVNGVVTVWLGDASAELDNILIRAYDSSGSVLAEDSGQIINVGGNVEAYDILSVSATGIAYVLASADHPVAMDDFTFDRPTPPPIPLPGSICLVGTGLVWMRLRRRTF